MATETIALNRTIADVRRVAREDFKLLMRIGKHARSTCNNIVDSGRLGGHPNVAPHLDRLIALDAVSTITYGCIISLETALPLPLSEGSDRGECVGFQTAGPDCGPHRCVRTTTETRTGPSAQRDRARGCHPAPVPA